MTAIDWFGGGGVVVRIVIFVAIFVVPENVSTLSIGASHVKSMRSSLVYPRLICEVKQISSNPKLQYSPSSSTLPVHRSAEYSLVFSQLFPPLTI